MLLPSEVRILKEISVSGRRRVPNGAEAWVDFGWGDERAQAPDRVGINSACATDPHPGCPRVVK
jgi:hypothetical protein